jgi:type VI secretion system protein ImpA
VHHARTGADACELITRLAREAGVLVTATAGSDAGDDNGTGSETEPTALGGSGGPIRTRAQALRQLRQVAEFFRRTEPHSPVAYLADKAATWGEIPLHQWLKQVIKDGGALAHLEELLGVDSSDGKNDESAE